MQSSPSHQSDGKLPVFVFPTSLIFYSEDSSTHKQVVTLYNPYEFPLKFKGRVVRHIDICVNNEGVKDKFRIQVTEHGQKKLLGKKDIDSMLLPKRESSTQPSDNFQSLGGSGLPPGESAQNVTPQHTARSRNPGGGPGLIVIFTAVSCIIALMLPIQGDSESRLPDYLQLSVHQKLIAAYILGLVTMVILHV
ncbi:hypothetical protein KUTeg_000978 [Tegillarca granosa]|uniref:Motile sperm domain-containing protein 1 n=1 Tax=Tegillarca granosa TaxID=220873 RepID=A0ABQ9FW29_TEGGR|nr:hypothetical protein KUTeg_000978 [Tegillarca granosa]